MTRLDMIRKMHKEAINLNSNVRAGLIWPVPRGKSLQTLKDDLDKKVVYPEQIHSGKVQEVDSSSAEIIPAVDGLVTKDPQVALGIGGADCQIILASAFLAKTIGVAHAGWKGLLADIVPNLLDSMERIGANRGEVKIWIGPCIGRCCYEIGPELSKDFKQKFGRDVFTKKDGSKYLDLRACQLKALTEAGIQKENINLDPRCTKCSIEQFSSHRREGPKRTGSNVAYLTLLG